jgi:hypothetical protein
MWLKSLAIDETLRNVLILNNSLVLDAWKAALRFVTELLWAYDGIDAIDPFGLVQIFMEQQRAEVGRCGATGDHDVDDTVGA